MAETTTITVCKRVAEGLCAIVRLLDIDEAWKEVIQAVLGPPTDRRFVSH